MNKSLNEIYNNLLSGNLSPDEWNYVFQLTGTESKDKASQVLENIIKNTEDYKSSIELNTNKAWARFETRIQAQNPPQISKKTKIKVFTSSCCNVIDFDYWYRYSDICECE